MAAIAQFRLIVLLIVLIVFVFYLLTTFQSRLSYLEKYFHLDFNSNLFKHNSFETFSLDEDINLIIYNRVPKTASTSFMGIAYDLCTKNHFNVIHLNTSKNSHTLSLNDQYQFVKNITNWKEKQPALYHGHVAYINFAKFGTASNPVYINIIRQPLDRLVSYYYFLRYGDDFRPYLSRRRQGNKVTFDECVKRSEKDCDPNLMWLQIPFFCGHFADCWNPGSEWALQEAKKNLISHYFLVGVTEQLHEFIAMLEITLPRFFRGSLRLFEKGNKSHLRKTINRMEPSPETVEKIKESKIWKMENEFYLFALEQFNFIKKRTLKAKGDTFFGKGRQFFYEKIRPRS